MKIGVIQASTRTDRNALLFEATKMAAKGHEVVNLGVFPDEIEHYSYVEVAVMVSLLIETRSLDFVVTGCSSGQGMMMACNSLPSLSCGYLQTPQDAYLFGRINKGNVASLSLGLNFGWSGELNLQYTLEKLFTDEFGIGYPPQDAKRKQAEAQSLQQLSQLTKRSFLEIVDEIDKGLLKKVLKRKIFWEYLQEHGVNQALLQKLVAIRN